MSWTVNYYCARAERHIFVRNWNLCPMRKQKYKMSKHIDSCRAQGFRTTIKICNNKTNIKRVGSYGIIIQTAMIILLHIWRKTIILSCLLRSVKGGNSKCQCLLYTVWTGYVRNSYVYTRIYVYARVYKSDYQELHARILLSRRTRRGCFLLFFFCIHIYVMKNRKLSHLFGTDTQRWENILRSIKKKK